ncbi:hypothetical protein TNIN_294701 [Trichonephila inaurata madagascariensis]|uniref:Uncharacterized protein n=1 Tax=Trichonephila inaurata madagascariensis TaxID=2747483 RepID=A0A8X6JXQ3_9ARAC|nr:hypothetical protein TNIN_294701 [Trichonephila inaurata madagascariensis]
MFLIDQEEDICLYLILLFDIVQQNLIYMVNVFKETIARVTSKRDISNRKTSEKNYVCLSSLVPVKTPKYR